jgi:hypothetical protein
VRGRLRSGEVLGGFALAEAVVEPDGVAAADGVLDEVELLGLVGRVPVRTGLA